MKKFLFNIFFIITLVFSSVTAFADTIKSIKVVGNKRIEEETILFEVQKKAGDQYNESTADEVLKNLNKTGYFEDISVKVSEGELQIFVKENPVINKIAYEGMKGSIRDSIKDFVKLRPRQILSKGSVQEAQQVVLEIYRRQGYLNAVVVPKIVRLPDDRVDLVFEISEGSPAYVRKISFVGNNSFISSHLKELLKIQEKKWFNIGFLGGCANKVYDPEKFIEDQQTLVTFFTNRGYADFAIISANAELSTDKKGFFITYHIHEGAIYKIGDVSIESKISSVDPKILQSVMITKKGQVFSAQIIEACSDIIKSIAASKGYSFAVVEPIFTKHSNSSTVDIKFVLKDGPAVFIERVQIKGNTHTHDRVIRRQVGFDEGDKFDKDKLKAAEERIKGLSYFKTVKVTPDDGSLPNRVLVNVEVEEQRTGEVFANLGYSSLEKFCIGAHLYEPNFRGKGQTFGIDIDHSQREFSGSIDFEEPNFLGRNLLGNTSLFFSKSKKMGEVSRLEIGTIFGIGYRLTRYFRQSWSYKIHRESMSLKNEKSNSTSNTLPKPGAHKHKNFLWGDEKDVMWGSSITHQITYDRRNRHFLPSKGYKLAFTTQFSGLGGDIFYLKNTLSGSVHKDLGKNIIFTVRANFSHARGLGKHDLRTANALTLGGDSMRGFDFYSISPVIGIQRKQLTECMERFLAKKHSGLTADQTKFLETNKEALKSLYQKTDDKDQMIAKLKLSASFSQMFKEYLQNDSDGRHFWELLYATGKKIGGTLAWNGSVELLFPMPFFPREAEVFGTIFTDLGASWRASSRYKDYKEDLLYDKHTLRLSTGFSVAWKSPFGLLSIGYAWPLKKTHHDDTLKFLFGYGMKFN